MSEFSQVLPQRNYSRKLKKVKKSILIGSIMFSRLIQATENIKKHYRKFHNANRRIRDQSLKIARDMKEFSREMGE